VPRFHLTWGTGPGVLAPFLRRLATARERGLVAYRPRHRVDGLPAAGDGSVTGVRGAVLEPSRAPRGQASSRTVVGEFSAQAPAVLAARAGSAGTSRRCAPRGRRASGRPRAA
jgi:predicted oxidoreductase